jgi:hypothetical protein
VLLRALHTALLLAAGCCAILVVMSLNVYNCTYCLLYIFAFLCCVCHALLCVVSCVVLLCSCACCACAGGRPAHLGPRSEASASASAAPRAAARRSTHAH